MKPQEETTRNHHEHDSHECCGHEHHHEHDGHECCGHEHHHEHEAHECCGHDHHHEHHHHEQHLEEGFSGIHTYWHDTALVASVTYHVTGSYEECVELVKQRMQAATSKIEEKGGIIGHVKAYIREDARNCMISITDSANICVKPGNGNGISVENANIVFGITEEEIREILSSVYAEWI